MPDVCCGYSWFLYLFLKPEKVRDLEGVIPTAVACGGHHTGVSAFLKLLLGVRLVGPVIVIDRYLLPHTCNRSRISKLSQQPQSHCLHH